MCWTCLFGFLSLSLLIGFINLIIAGNRKDVAVKFLRAILSCSNVPDVIVCSAALFDAQIALDQNNLKYAAAVCKRLVECPQWVSSTELLRNLLGLINTRINIKADPNYPFPSMVGKKLEV